MFLTNLRAQEQLCVDKYKFYAGQAKDEELKQLFTRIGKNEKEHYDVLGSIMEGRISSVDVADTAADTYKPSAKYAKGGRASDKKHDQFLCTDSITTEKYVSTSYSNDLFHFASPELRRVLNQIATEEQNHAELIYLYKSANDMN